MNILLLFATFLCTYRRNQLLNFTIRKEGIRTKSLYLFHVNSKIYPIWPGYFKWYNNENHWHFLMLNQFVKWKNIKLNCEYSNERKYTKFSYNEQWTRDKWRLLMLPSELESKWISAEHNSSSICILVSIPYFH